MDPLVKFGDHRSYRNGDINSYINFNKDTSKKNELTASIIYIAIFSKSERAICNIEIYNLSSGCHFTRFLVVFAKKQKCYK